MLLPKGISQIEIPEFSHIIVPEQFDFLKGKDKYQLNSLTKFLLKKNGFDAVYESELSTINRCEVLWADLDRDDGMIFTKISLVLTNCNGTEVARSQQGKSKLKDYKKAYQESIRNALKDFKASQFTMIPSEEKEVSLPIAPIKDIEQIVVPEVIDVPKISTPTQVPVEQLTVPKSIESPVNIPKTYTFSDYAIVPNAAGGAEILYKGAAIGNLIPSAVPDLYLVRTSQFYGIARKTLSGYVVEREKDGSNSLLIMKFD